MKTPSNLLSQPIMDRTPVAGEEAAMILGYTLSLSDPRAKLETVGGKGASLARLANAGLPVPDGFHVTTTAYREFVAINDLQPFILETLKTVDISQPATLETASRAIGERFSQGQMQKGIMEAIAQAYDDLPGDHPVVAVRSSATAEDLPGLSFAGQQETFLNIHGLANILNAVKCCWASLWTARAIGYRLQHGVDQNALSLAVVVQILVHAEAAGVLFTANPVNGQRDQAMITASWGLGEAVVGGLVTPDTLTVDKATGQVVAREIAEKQVMTVLLESGTEEHPVTETLRRAAVLSDREAAELVRLGNRIERLYAMPMDIEWALAEGKTYIVQARPITALPAEAGYPKPETPTAVEWKPPNPKGTYMRGSVADLAPGPMSPLYSSMGIPAIGQMGIKKVMKAVTRSEPILPADYVTTINGYVYAGITFTPRQWWWIFSRMILSYPRILRMGIPLWRDDMRPRYAAAVNHLEARSLGEMSPAELLFGIRELVETSGEYIATLLVSTMGASAGSEGLFSRVYEKTLKREGDPPASAFLMGYNNLPIRTEKSLYDLAEWARTSQQLSAYLLNTSTPEIVHILAANTQPAGVTSGEWSEFKARFRTHLEQYGHAIFTVDFGHPLPLDNPTPMLEAIKMYLRGEGTNPHDRQGAAEQKRKSSVEAMLSRTRGLRRWAFQKALNWAQSLSEVREDAIADIGIGYPLLRRMLRELGRRFLEAGAIEQAEDVFWLQADELADHTNLLETGKPLPSLVQRIQERKAYQERMKNVTPPPMLPLGKKKYLGIDMSSFMPADESSQTGGILKGVGASPGKATAPARVLHGPEDFDQMRPGDVLVAGTTTPAWTPLFAMASAVVTDIGGPLSHGSIVAREYGIPAVMGTGVATRRIRSGQVVTVDGSEGIVILSKNGS